MGGGEEEKAEVKEEVAAAAGQEALQPEPNNELEESLFSFSSNWQEMATAKESKLLLIQRHIRSFADFPKEGVLFRWALGGVLALVTNGLELFTSLIFTVYSAHKSLF